MDIYAIYLRKSRSDEQAEARGEGDVLARHRKTLHELAAYNGDTIIAEYAEVASGDSLTARPQAQRLLLDVMAGRYAGVYCMALDRLSRGAAEDQAAVIRAFQASGTLIITPEKVYDFTKDADEDFGELRLMFSRIEHKTIKRRMYAGREHSAKEGWYLGSRDVFGYRRVPAAGQNGPTLEIIPGQAELVREMFRMYAAGNSSHQICDMLNAQPIRPNYSQYWTPSSVRGILKNPIYAGRMTWAKRVKKAVVLPDGSTTYKRVINDKPIIVPGRQPAIVSEAEFDAVAALMAGHKPPSVKAGKPLENPLAGLIRCARCGQVMQRQQDKLRPDVLRCHNRQCNQMRGDLATVEWMILRHLDNYFALAYEPAKVESKSSRERDHAAKLIRDQIRQVEQQQSRQAEFLEQGVYTVEEFIKRRNETSVKLTELRKRLKEATEPDMYEERLAQLRKVIGHSMCVSEAYRKAGSAAQKNALLKSIVESIKYDKTERRQGKYDSKSRGIELEFRLLF